MKHLEVQLRALERRVPLAHSSHWYDYSSNPWNPVPFDQAPYMSNPWTIQEPPISPIVTSDVWLVRPPKGRVFSNWNNPQLFINHGSMFKTSPLCASQDPMVHGINALGNNEFKQQLQF